MTDQVGSNLCSPKTDIVGASARGSETPPPVKPRSRALDEKEGAPKVGNLRAVRTPAGRHPWTRLQEVLLLLENHSDSFSA